VGKGLVIVHVDGLGADALQRALDAGLMPFTKRLLDQERYELHTYRCGVPSTTPFAQAGILYGDNSNIPSFRWWDRQRRLAVQFGARSTFKKVADKYFAGTTPLTKGGACIAACYPAGAKDDFGIAYHERTYGEDERSRSAWRVLLPYLLDPGHLGDWAGHAALSIVRTAGEYVSTVTSGHRPAAPYVVSDAVEEVFVHHLTRYAVEQAMRERFAPIYAGFYAYDEVGHAFGPDDSHSERMLRHVDRTVHAIARARGDAYELLVLSDHGQVPAARFDHLTGASLGELVARWMPGFHVEELNGKKVGPPAAQAKGAVKLSFSGGLGHVYLSDNDWRLTADQVSARYPALLSGLLGCDHIALVMAQRGDEDVFWTKGRELSISALAEVLARYDDPAILREQLHRLNRFETAGDLVLFGAFIRDRQVNFENQLGGHGSIGGEQLHPFMLARREWELDTSHVRGAHELHPMLSALRDRLSA
jgi:hypothetical protein